MDTLGLDDDVSPAVVTFILVPHCITRATLTAIYSILGEPGVATSLRGGQ